jgi:hypothetical protein
MINVMKKTQLNTLLINDCLSKSKRAANEQGMEARYYSIERLNIELSLLLGHTNVIASREFAWEQRL